MTTNEFNKVIHLEVSDFDFNKKEIKTNHKVIIMVQRSGCHHCTKAKPEFVKAKKQCGENAIFATISGDQEPKLAEKIHQIIGKEINGVPEYLYFKNRKFVKIYGDERDSRSICNFILQN